MGTQQGMKLQSRKGQGTASPLSGWIAASQR